MDPTRRPPLRQLILSGTLTALLWSVPTGAQSGAQSATGPPSLQGERRPFTQVAPPYPAPLTPMYTAKGGVANLRRYRGRVVVLNFWATWCVSCLHELPALSRLQNDLGGEQFDVVTLNVDEANPARVARFFTRLGITNLPRLQDPAGRAPAAFKTHHGLPWSFIIDRDGLVQGYIMGSVNWDSDPARKLLAYYLKQIPGR